jgi:histidine decarboxylase
MVLCGQDQDVTYEAIFLGAKYIFAGADEWGCALTCAPYVTLAQNAVPNGVPSELLNMTIDQWEAAVVGAKLPPAPIFDGLVGEIGATLEN